MRFVARLIVVGFAGFGMYKAWEALSPKMSEARVRASGARERIEPAIREAADTLQTATKDAAEELTSSNGVDPGAPLMPEHVSPPPKMAP
jgi:hypothetical protein